MVEKLLSHELWSDFFAYKTSRKMLTSKEERQLRDFIADRKYLPIAEQIVSGGFHFSIPVKKALSKHGTAKKRFVYCFPDDENIMLKMLSWLLYQYDSEIPNNCYSFRKSTGARNAFLKVAQTAGIEELFGYKADISDYFNSIDVSLLLPLLREIITDDACLLQLLTELLCDDRAIWQGKVIREKRGVMAGTPTSPFFANLYLKEMDEYFAATNALYARYSDDILIFANKEEIGTYIDVYQAFLRKYQLAPNPAKEQRFVPGDSWSFLGFKYDKGTIDISDIAVRKLMDKIRRAAKSLRRWMLKNGASSERTLRAFNRKFNRKFYNGEEEKELCWCRWYFPIINTTQSLHFIDRYMQEWQRYIITGKHNKANYRKVPYSMLVENGYRPLVSAYYDREKLKL